MRIRYVGSHPDGVELVCSGVSYGIAKPDEVLEVPDEVYQAHAWSEEVWAEVAPTRKKGDG